MKWLTEAQIKKHATTPTKALNISIKHWQQIVDATASETNEAPLYFNYAEYCGTCLYYCNDCLRCPIRSCGSGSQWDDVATAFCDWERSEVSFAVYKKECRKMLKLLKSLKGLKNV